MKATLSRIKALLKQVEQMDIMREMQASTRRDRNYTANRTTPVRQHLIQLINLIINLNSSSKHIISQIKEHSIEESSEYPSSNLDIN